MRQRSTCGNLLGFLSVGGKIEYGTLAVGVVPFLLLLLAGQGLDTNVLPGQTNGTLLTGKTHPPTRDCKLRKIH